jgi:hypothetical protein
MSAEPVVIAELRKYGSDMLTAHNEAEVVADTLAAYDAAVAERDAARRVIAWANNSLFGSHNFFIGAHGEHHLDTKIEDLKADNGRLYAANEALCAQLAAAQPVLDALRDAATADAQIEALYAQVTVADTACFAQELALGKAFDSAILRALEAYAQYTTLTRQVNV